MRARVDDLGRCGRLTDRWITSLSYCGAVADSRLVRHCPSISDDGRPPAAGAAEAGLAGHLAIERVGAWLGSSVDIGHAVCSAQVGVGWPRLLWVSLLLCSQCGWVVNAWNVIRPLIRYLEACASSTAVSLHSAVQSAFFFAYTDPMRSSLCRAGLCTVSESCCTAFAGASAHAALNCLYVERGSLV